MTRQQNYVRRIQQGATVPVPTQLQSLISTLCDADQSTVTDGWMREASPCTCDEFAQAAEEERLDRWARAVFSLFDPYDYQLYRVYAETVDPLLARDSEVQS